MFARHFQNLSIRWKLICMITATTGVALLAFTILSAFMQIRVLRMSMFEDLKILSESVADMSSADLSFSDIYQTQEVLTTLRADPNIEISVIYDEHGRPFYAYMNPRFSVTAMLPQIVETEAVNRLTLQNRVIKVEIFTPVILDGKRIGTLYVLSNTERLANHLRNTVFLLVLSMLFIVSAAGLFSDYLQRIITRPLLRVAMTARKISREGDYSLRVEKTSDDEVGQFIDDFNVMVATVEAREEDLNDHQQNLARLVNERTEELRVKRDEALAASCAKSEFLANMSHEIRTPMNGVIGVLSLLQDAPLSEEYRRLLAAAGRSADSLLMIIDDILDFSKIDAGMVTFEAVVFDLRSLVEEATRLFIDMANSKGLELSCFIPAEIPRKVKGDPTRLRQILTNLLSNAVKFTEKGEVILVVEEAGRTDDLLQLKFMVKDSGIGISEEGMERIFDKFTQADGSTERKYGGTGLGLSVCRQLVEKQGGSIDAKSRKGEGAEFYFILPFEVYKDSVAEPEAEKLSGKHFVLVGSSSTCEMVVRNYLEACGSSITYCNSAEDGLNTLQEMQSRDEPVHAVLLDHRMPEFSGMRFAEDIRAWLGADTPEIVMLYSGMLSEQQLGEAGIRASLLKPVSRCELYAVLVDVVLKRERGEHDDNLSESTMKFSGTVLLVDDEPINQKVMMAIMQKLGLHADVADTGYQAVKMAAKRDYSLILMDVQMPEMSGIEATEHIRQEEALEGRRRTPIIAVTANALESTRQRCLAVGMDDFITKPTQPDALSKSFRPWLEIQEPERGNQEGQDNGGDWEEGSRSEKIVWEHEKALEFVGRDQELLRQLIQLFLERSSVLIENVEAAVERGDPQNLIDAAHAYKGAVTHFAAGESRRLAYALEIMGKREDMSGAVRVFGELRLASEQLAAELRDYLKELNGP